MTIEPSRAEVAPADQIATLTDGRRLAYRAYGDPQGAAVIALHGTPGSRFKYAGSHAAALRSGIRLIALDRWGYGGSSPHSHGRLEIGRAHV